MFGNEVGKLRNAFKPNYSLTNLRSNYVVLIWNNCCSTGWSMGSHLHDFDQLGVCLLVVLVLNSNAKYFLLEINLLNLCLELPLQHFELLCL